MTAMVTLDGSDSREYGESAFSAPMLDRLRSERVFRIVTGPRGVRIRECCDDYFVLTVTADDLRALATELLEVADMVERPARPACHRSGA